MLTGMSVTGKVSGEPIWHPYKSQNGEFLEFSFQYSEVIWPWSGFLAVFITASKDAKNFEGIAQGHVSITIESPTEEGCTKNKTSFLNPFICSNSVISLSVKVSDNISDVVKMSTNRYYFNWRQKWHML
jgi:hypothetical protein